MSLSSRSSRGKKRISKKKEKIIYVDYTSYDACWDKRNSIQQKHYGINARMSKYATKKRYIFYIENMNEKLIQSLESLNNRVINIRGTFECGVPHSINYSDPGGAHFHSEFSHYMNSTSKTIEKIRKEYDIIKEYKYSSYIHS